MSANTVFDDRRIVVAVDGSAASDAAVVWAARESRLRRAPVTLLHAVPPAAIKRPLGPLMTEADACRDDGNAPIILELARKTFHANAGASVTAMAVETEVVRNNVVATLSDASRHAQMVVVGCRGLGAVRRLLLGSASAGLLRHAHCPVAVVHHHDGELGVPSPAAPVLVGIDGSPTAEKAVAFAFDEASRRGTDLVALHAWSDVGVFPAVMDWRTVESEAHEVLAERLAGWQERYPDVRVKRRIVCDKPASWLIEGSENAQRELT